MKNELDTRILSITVKNHAGVLTRIASLYTQRGYNIESIAAGVTEDPDVTRITLVVSGKEDVLHQVTLLVHQLVEVIKIDDLTDTNYVERELAMIQVKFEPENRAEIAQIVDVFRASIIDVGKNNFIIEITGNHEKIDAFQTMMQNYEIMRVARTGKVALERGDM